jgi:hypothetical protein
MARNPLSKIKGRLSSAIDWRVRQEFETERDVMMGISETVTTMNIAYADKISAMERLVEDLHRRVTELETKLP